MKKKIFLTFLVGLFGFVGINDVNAVTYKKYEDGIAVYYNPVEGKKCTDYKQSNSATKTKTGCMKFYTFNDSENSSTVNMILDHNTTVAVAWNSSGNKADGMNEVKTALESDTASWKETARLITADEIAEITGAKDALDWTSNKTFNLALGGGPLSYYYLDGASGDDPTWHTQIANDSVQSKYKWLYNNTYECFEYGCNSKDTGIYEGNHYVLGYWTSTPTVGASCDTAWYVTREGSVSGNSNVSIVQYGVRPVITISKSLLDANNSNTSTGNNQNNSNTNTSTGNNQNNSNTNTSTNNNQNNSNTNTSTDNNQNNSNTNTSTDNNQNNLNTSTSTDNNEVNSNLDTTTEKNPQTGIKNIGLGILIVGLISFIFYLVIRNKKIFIK